MTEATIHRCEGTVKAVKGGWRYEPPCGKEYPVRQSETVAQNDRRRHWQVDGARWGTW